MRSVNGFWKRDYRSKGEILCLMALNQARNPYFYENLDVPDTLEGRFDCAVLHMCLFLRHLKGSLAQAIFDSFFAYTELTLREIGVGDLSVGRQVKKCAQFFYGALQSYDEGLDDKASLQEALRRNLYGSTCPLKVKELTDYVRKCDQILRKYDFEKNPLTPIIWPI